MARKGTATPVADKETETKDEAAETTFSAKDLAAEAGTDPKTFRRWLRSQTPDRANKGGRWIFSEDTKADWLERYNNRGAARGTEAAASDDKG